MRFTHPRHRVAALAGVSMALIATATVLGQSPPAKPASAPAVAKASSAEAFLPLARYAPKDDLLLLAEFEGLDSQAAAWNNSALNHILNDTSTGVMFEDIFTKGIDQLLASRPEPAKVGSADLLAMFKHIAHNGFLFAVSGKKNAAGDDLTPETETTAIVLRNAARKDMRPLFAKLIGALNNPAATSAKVVKSGRNVVVNTLPGVDKGWSWWIEGDDLVFAPGSATNPDRILAVLDKKQPSAIENPTRQELMKPEGPFTPLLVAFAELAKMPVSPGQPTFGGANRVDFRWGFEHKATMSVLNVRIPEPRTGLASLLDQAAFTVTNLPPIPESVDNFTVLSLDLSAIYGQLVKAVTASDPAAAAKVAEMEKDIKDKTRSRLKEDILGRIGPKIAFYTLPTKKAANPVTKAAGLGIQIPRMVIVADLKDQKAFSRLFDGLMLAINKQMEAAMPPPPEADEDDAKKKQSAAAKRAAAKKQIPHFRLGSPDPKTYVLALPPQIAALTNLNLTLAIGKKSLVIATASGAARETLALEATSDGRWTPKGELKEALERLPKELTVLQVSDPSSTLPNTLAKLPTTLPAMLAAIPTGAAPPPGLSFPGGQSPPGQVGGGLGNPTAPAPPGVPPTGSNTPYPGLGGPPGGQPGGAGPGPIVLNLDPSKAPSADAVKRLLFPGSAALAIDANGARWIKREAFPGLSLSPESNAGTGIAIALILPAIQSAREAARRSQDTNSLKMIGLAAHNYAAANNGFPLASINDNAGKPLLSWRVALLPYLEHEDLYKKFKLDEPWDGPNNSKLIPLMPPEYAIKSANGGGPGLSNIRAFVGPSTVLQPGAPATTMASITDGTSNTIAAFESSLAIPWTKPEEPSPDVNGLTAIVGVGRPRGEFLALFADGSVKLLRGGLDDLTLRALMTRDGKEVIDLNTILAPSSSKPPAQVGAAAAPGVRTVAGRHEAR